MSEPAHKRQLTSMVYATPLMTPSTALGLSIQLSMFELRETGDWDVFFFLHFFFPKSDKISTFFPEIGQGLSLHFRGLCTLMNPFLAREKIKMN